MPVFVRCFGDFFGCLRQVIGGQVRVSQHHGVARPTAELHQSVWRYAVLDGPRGEGVPQGVPMKRADSRPFYGVLKGFGVAVGDTLAAPGEENFGFAAS